MNIQYLTVPGLAGSGPFHWQSIWEKQHPSLFSRVEQDNWDWPEMDVWVEQLNVCIQNQKTPTILIGHSLGCITILHWAARYRNSNIAGALLVAPADAELSKRLSFVKGFSPIPSYPLPFPAVIVASTNDRYMTIERAEHFSSKWKCPLINIGKKGHINAVSNLSDWKEGKGILFDLTQQLIAAQQIAIVSN